MRSFFKIKNDICIFLNEDDVLSFSVPNSNFFYQTYSDSPPELFFALFFAFLVGFRYTCEPTKAGQAYFGIL